MCFYDFSSIHLGGQNLKPVISSSWQNQKPLLLQPPPVSLVQYLPKTWVWVILVLPIKNKIIYRCLIKLSIPVQLSNMKYIKTVKLSSEIMSNNRLPLLQQVLSGKPIKIKGQFDGEGSGKRLWKESRAVQKFLNKGLWAQSYSYMNFRPRIFKLFNVSLMLEINVFRNSIMPQYSNYIHRFLKNLLPFK